MSPSGHALSRSLRRASRSIRVDGALAVTLAALTVVPVVLLLAWAWGGGGWGARSPGPLVLVAIAALGGVTIAVVYGWRWVRAVDDTAVAAAAERGQSLPEGSLRGVLELGRGLPSGVSAALFLRTESQLAGRLAGSSSAALAGELGERARRRRTRLLLALAGAGVLVAGVGLATPERARAAWVPLLSPIRHAAGPTLPPLEVLPGDAEVQRGGVLDVDVRAPFRSEVTLHWRETGDIPDANRLPVRAGAARGALGPVGAPMAYWVTAPDGSASDTFRIEPVDPLLVTQVRVDVVYPPHTGREPDRYEGEVGALRVPEGTRLRISGSANRPLAAAGLRHEDGRTVTADADGPGFALEWRPGVDATGRWDWELTGEDGAAALAPTPLDLSVVADAAPQVRVVVPGRDTVFGPSRQQPLVADASDDYGVADAALVFWRVDGAGRSGEPARVPIPVNGGDRVLLHALLDASDQPLVPGDAIHYRIEVRDNGRRSQVATSGTFALRLPGRSELRERARAETGELLDDAAELARLARELETATRDLGRQSPNRGRQGSAGGEAGRTRGSERVGFEQATEAGQIAEQQQDMLAKAEELRDRLSELRQALDQAGLRDPELRERLAELRDLYDQLGTPELQQDVDALREAVEQLDPEAVNRAMEQLARQQAELREQLDEGLEKLRRAAAEQELDALARDIQELAAQQEALAESMRSGAEPRDGSDASNEAAEARTAPDSAGGTQPSPQGMPDVPTPARADNAKQQDELEARTRELGESMESLQQRLMQLGEQDASASAGAAREQSEGARQAMQQASSQARQQQGEEASQSGEQAAGQLSEAAATLDQARSRMADAARQQTQQAMRQATQEALGLAEREESLRQQMEQARQQGGGQGEAMQQMRSEQGALRQGLDQLGRNLSEAGQRSGMLSRDVGQALARATLDMQQTMDGMQDGPGQLPVEQAGRTVESLNQLAMSLLQNEAQVQASQNRGGLEQALDQLSQIARDQASLNGQLGALGPMELDPRAMTQQLQQAAMQQRNLARRMGSASDMVGGQENVLGRLDLLSSEAEAIARELEGGRLDARVRERQERLFHRLLDAGRTLEGEEYSDERVGNRPGAVEAGTPGAIDPALLESRLRYRPPSAAELRALPPAYRRLILEYFDRLNRTGPDTGGDG